MRARPCHCREDRANGAVDTVFSDLAEPALEELSACTRCLISTVGPYIKYGSAVVAACARNGTHYVDSTGEVPWVMDMIEMHHRTARANGAIVGAPGSPPPAHHR